MRLSAVADNAFRILASLFFPIWIFTSFFLVKWVACYAIVNFIIAFT
jgi:hypothetical protein